MLVPAIALAWCVVSLPMRSFDVAETTVRPQAMRAAVTAMQPAPVRDEAASVGERVMIRGAIPAGVIAFAKTLVNYPMGSEQVTEVDGQRYVFVLERHYHPPGFVGAPSGWHKGVTAYALR